MIKLGGFLKLGSLKKRINDQFNSIKMKRRIMRFIKALILLLYSNTPNNATSIQKNFKKLSKRNLHLKKSTRKN